MIVQPVACEIPAVITWMAPIFAPSRGWCLWAQMLSYRHTARTGVIDSESADGVTMYSNQLGRHSLGRNAPIRHSFFPFRKLYVLQEPCSRGRVTPSKKGKGG